MLENITIFTDGGARGNPGPSGIGAVIYEGKTRLAEVSEFIGHATNNWAEYQAVIRALETAVHYGLSGRTIEFRLDSKLVAEQLMGNWRVKEETLKPQWARARSLIEEHFKDAGFTYIPREKNKEADRLANDAMDKGA
jgi:ribonuclease HI